MEPESLTKVPPEKIARIERLSDTNFSRCVICQEDREDEQLVEKPVSYESFGIY